jgi:hypothetical protein
MKALKKMALFVLLGWLIKTLLLIGMILGFKHFRSAKK